MKLNIINIEIGKLKPYEANAKLHPAEQVAQIAASITEFGFNDPIAVWGDDNLIIEGHGRLLVSSLTAFAIWRSLTKSTRQLLPTDLKS